MQRSKDLVLMSGIGESLYRIGLVGQRVIRQIKRDRRTIGLITINPIILMVLLGYSLSGSLSGIELGIVALNDGIIQEGLQEHLRASDAFSLTYIASESDADRLISEGRLDGAVILGDKEIRLFLDGASPQIASTITAEVGAGMQAGAAKVLGSLTGQIADQKLLPPVVTYYVYGYDLEVKDSVGPALLGISIFFFTFLATTISFLRERIQGTLEKIMASPLNRIELVAGYVLGFSAVAAVQSASTFLVLVVLFKVPMKGSLLAALVVILFVSAGALSFGAFLSNFARSEFQVIQFIPLVVTPQIVLSGIWTPLQSIPEWLRPVSYIFPLTYSNDALRLILLKGASLSDVLYPDLFALLVFFAVTFALATMMLKKEVG